jgi:hypothetical protein
MVKEFKAPTKLMRNWTWKELEKIWARESVGWSVPDKGTEIGDILDETPARYRKALAAAFSMLKWAPGAPHRGDGVCGLCTQYYAPDDCADCPLAVKLGESCINGLLFMEAEREIRDHLQKEAPQ